MDTQPQIFHDAANTQGNAAMKRVSAVFVLSAALILALSAVPALAHPGNVDKEGCHVQKSTGQRHCHPERRKAGGEAPKKAPATDKKPSGDEKSKQQ
ncbi:hypothetical protein M2352_002500 [Azospirillum fermentarium]|uniref:YHYH domain-containing protein n=1 Tax=Azospirillum fermentarium TaxID=1233114 RepID=UPI002227C9FA|nr:YHYH domain-containing protein [Azospirillum fermentarium]MCW2246909.1 hypothetical protein [Azospirillum fermentarium]